MTYDQLKNRYQGARFTGYGHWRVTFIYRNHTISCTTTDSMAIDRLNDDNEGRKSEGFYSTKKQALESLYNEAKRKSGIYGA